MNHVADTVLGIIGQILIVVAGIVSIIANHKLLDPFFQANILSYLDTIATILIIIGIIGFICATLISRHPKVFGVVILIIGILAIVPPFTTIIGSMGGVISMIAAIIAFLRSKSFNED